MNSFVALTLVCLFSLSKACFNPQPANNQPAAVVPPAVVAPAVPAVVPPVTRQSTTANTCTGTEGGTIVGTLLINQEASATPTVQVTQTGTWTGTGTQKALCYSVTDTLTGGDMSTYTVSGINTNTLTFNAKSAAGKKIALVVAIIGTL